MVRMLFGKKHYGEPLEEIPMGYLDWMLRECDPATVGTILFEAVRAEVVRRLQGRSAPPPPAQPQPQPSRAVANLDSIIKQWFGIMAKKWHPDRGGDVKAMAALNDAHDQLRKLLGV